MAQQGENRTPDKTIGVVKYAEQESAEMPTFEAPVEYAPQGGQNITADKTIGIVEYANPEKPSSAK